MIFKIPNHKILVIDDFAQMRNTARRMLMDFKATDIDDCGNGEEAIEMMRKKRYDIVLCDYNLGEGKDGQQVLEEARHAGILDFAAIFMMITAENTSGMVLAAVEYEPDDYLTKPFNKDLLAKRLERLVNRKKGLHLIGKALKEKDYSKAIAMCDRLIVEFPKNALSLIKTKAAIHQEANEYDQAAKVYEKLLEKYNVAWARLGLGKVKFLQEDYLAAKDIFTSLIKEFPNQIEAYDWLAKTHAALGENQEAQHILQSASDKSPNVLVRRQNLADMALINEDAATAERSFKAAIKLSKDSSFKRADDFSNLAKILLDQKKDQKALQTIRQGTTEFRDAPNDMVKLTVTESKIHHTVNREAPAKEALSRAVKIYEKHPDDVAGDTNLEVAEACITYGDKETGMKLMKEVIENNHDDEAILEKAQEAFNKAGLEDEGKSLLENSISNIVNINNEGARLANEGKLDEAIELFTNAAKKMPRNKVINLNAAQALIIHMQKNGGDMQQLTDCKTYLQNVKQLDATDNKYRKLLRSFQELEAAHKKQST